MEEEYPSVDVDYEIEDDAGKITPAFITGWVDSVFAELKLQGKHCSLLFCTPASIRRLNHEFRGKDYETDVLSFSQVEGEEITGSQFLGDIVVSLEAAQNQAAELKHSLEEEVKYLVLHGILHLLGYDHDENEDGEMSVREKEIYFKLTGDILE